MILNRDITTFTGVLTTQQTSVSHAGSWCQPPAPRTTCADCPVPAGTGGAKHELHALHALYPGLSPGATIRGYLPALWGSLSPKAQAPLVKNAMWCYTDTCICNISTMVSRSCWLVGLRPWDTSAPGIWCTSSTLSPPPFTGRGASIFCCHNIYRLTLQP